MNTQAWIAGTRDGDDEVWSRNLLTAWEWIREAICEVRKFERG